MLWVRYLWGYSFLTVCNDKTNGNGLKVHQDDFFICTKKYYAIKGKKRTKKPLAYSIDWSLRSLANQPKEKLGGICRAHQAPLSMEFSRQKYWIGSHSLLQRIFPTQGSNLGLLHCRQILYHLSHQGSPGRICYHCIRSGGEERKLFVFTYVYIKYHCRTSLVAQWIRICLPA